jgi:beta-barrel assembly-enhancing protease
MSQRPGFVLLLFATMLGIIAVAGCATNPVTGRTELALISPSQQIAIGTEQYLPSQQSQGGQYTVDPELSAYVTRIGQRLVAVSDNQQLPYEFVVLNDSVPNAWALPGGKIAVNRGLLVELNNEAELAAVLGHEIVHAAAGHGASSMQRGMLLQGLIVATGLSAADSEYANYIVGGAQLGAQLVSQTYSRSAELESDHYGTIYMKRAGYNPQAAVTLQETFVRLSEGQKAGWITGLFASHPPSQERVNANRELAAALGTSGEIGELAYETRVALVKDDRPAYQQFDEAVRLASKQDYGNALVNVNHAIEVEPREPRFYGLRGDIYLAEKKYAAATTEFTHALDKDDQYYAYYLGRGVAQSRLGEIQEAKQDLLRSNQLLPTAVANHELGVLTLAGGDRSLAKQYFQVAMGSSGKVGQEAAAAFIRLDLPENPSRYLDARLQLTEDKKLVGELINRAPFTLRNVAVEFSIRTNGQLLRQTLTIAAIPPGREIRVPSGWQFGGSDRLTEARITVQSASPE